MGVHCRVKSLCPRPWEESFHSSQLSHGVSPLHLSQHGVRSSSSLWTSRTSSLTNSCGSNMVGCLNPYSTEPYKSSACNSLTGFPIPASWERESGDPRGSQLWPEDWVLLLVPNEQQSWEQLFRDGAVGSRWPSEKGCQLWMCGSPSH